MSGISACQVGAAHWLKVESKGCLQNSADVERYVDDLIQTGEVRFVVDLAHCQGLDSTFMGMLLSLAKRLSRSPGGCLHIINAQGRNGELLRGLGVHYFCNVSDDAGGLCTGGHSTACQCAEELPHQDLSKREQTEHCLKAHEGLAEVTPENSARFRDVIELMRHKLVAQP